MSLPSQPAAWRSAAAPEWPEAISDGAQLAAAIPKLQVASGTPVPLGHAQLCFWFVYATIGETANNLVHLEIEGALDVMRLERALERMIQRHDVLRMRIGKWKPVQTATDAGSFDLAVQDLGKLDAAERDAAALRVSREFLDTPFDLAAPPLLRVRLLKMEPQRHLLLLCFPHIVADGGAVHLFERQLLDTYDRLGRGLPAAGREAGLQIGDYASWEREHCRRHGVESEAFWRRQLADHPYAPWPAEHLAKGKPVLRIDYLPLSDAVLDAWTRLARGHKATFQMCIVSAIGQAVHALTGCARFSLNSVLESREHAETEDLMGPLLRIMPVPFTFDPASPQGRSQLFQSTLAAVRKHTVAAYEHMAVPWSLPLGLLAEQRWQRGASPLLRTAIRWGSRLFPAMVPSAKLYPRFLADFLYMEPRPPRSLLAALRGNGGDGIAVPSPMININVLQAVFKPDAAAVRSSALQVRRVDGAGGDAADASAARAPAESAQGSWENDSINCYVVDRGQGRPTLRIETACLSESGMRAFVAALREGIATSDDGHHRDTSWTP